MQSSLETLTRTSSGSKPHPWRALLSGEVEWTAPAEPDPEPVPVSALPPARGLKVSKQSRNQPTSLGDFLDDEEEDEADADEMDVDGDDLAPVDDFDRDEEDDGLKITILSRAGTVDTHPEPEVVEGDSEADRSDDHTPIIELSDDE